MRVLRQSAALFVLLLSVGPLWLVNPAAAETTAGLTVEVYTFDPQSTPERRAYELCASGVTTLPQIAQEWGGGVVAGCQEDFVLLHYYGYITLPVDGLVTFQSMADDGFYLEIGDNVVINDWTLKGCGGSQGSHEFKSGVSQKIDVWFYEYGGGACNYLYYTDPVTGFGLVPESAFSTEGKPYVPPVVPPTLSKPIGLNGVANGTSVDLVWASVVEDTAIENYAVTWTYGDNPGWGISSLEQSATITNLPEDTDVTFRIRSDNNTLRVYSDYSDPITIRTGFTPIVVPPVDPPVEPPIDPVDPVEPPIEPEVPVEPPVEPEPPVIPEPPVVEPEPELPPALPVELPEPQPQPKPQPEEGAAEIPEVIENLMEVNLEAVDPTELTEAQAEQLVEAALVVFETAEAGSPEYKQALNALYLAAQQDDIVVDEALAAIPLIGNLAVGLTDALNFAGNIGADMSPKVREMAEKQVLVSVVAVGAAVQAAAGAATSAAAAAASSTSSRKN